MPSTESTEWSATGRASAVRSSAAHPDSPVVRSPSTRRSTPAFNRGSDAVSRREA